MGISGRLLDEVKSLYKVTVSGPDGGVVMSSANGLVGTGFTSRYRLQPGACFKGPMGRRKATTPSSLSLTSNLDRQASGLLFNYYCSYYYY